ncbi:DUF1499 domain-containing protein [Paenibacillus hemerocallicola]|uniref:DUF1499 domain-containing protein n=1 Tax=Paenibacillus hemerocallicola TaxID=1172614 RepID=A0A5C4TA08_9BACL|nr:DUF1499 domain-containing protein [Paenibacillus hemerocallicola]TNJ65752.1 DUF1499 domain-containing protein [Paenibacillus hemerocallicola]
MLKRMLVGLIRSHEVTGDKARDPALKTRYYKLPKDKLWEEVISLLKKLPKYTLLHEVKNVGEIVVTKRTITGRTQDITLTLFSINPVKSAIDIYSASRGSLGDLGANYRTITELFGVIDQKLGSHKTDK